MDPRVKLRGLLGTLLDLVRVLFDVLSHCGAINLLKDDSFSLTDLNQIANDLWNREMRFARNSCSGNLIRMPGGTLMKELQNVTDTPSVYVSG